MAASLSAKPGLEDMETLLWGSSFLTADPLGHLLDEDEEEILAEGAPSPLSSSSSSSAYADAFPSSPLSSLSPPSSPPPLLGCKAGADPLAFPWLSADELPYGHISAGSSNEDAFSGMDWMAEKMDLSEFDLDSLMGSCDSDESPSSPDDLIASLESAVDLGLDPLPLPGPDSLLFNPTAPEAELAIALPDLPAEPLPEPQKELEIKSEPPSPVPSPSLLPPPSPTFTLDLGSEVDVSESEKAPPAEKVQVPSIVLSLSPSNIVLLLAPKEEPTAAGATSCSDPSESDSGVSSTSGSPRHSPCSSPSPPPMTGSSRTKPYSRPRPATETQALTGRVKSASDGGAPKVVEKKLKKMEQNKTAATRYRQKKRAEQEALSAECSELEQRNQELTEKAESISKEIQYLKDLIEEVRKAKSRKTKGMS